MSYFERIRVLDRQQLGLLLDDAGGPGRITAEQCRGSCELTWRWQAYLMGARSTWWAGYPAL